MLDELHFYHYGLTAPDWVLPSSVNKQASLKFEGCSRQTYLCANLLIFNITQVFVLWLVDKLPIWGFPYCLYNGLGRINLSIKLTGVAEFQMRTMVWVCIYV